MYDMMVALSLVMLRLQFSNTLSLSSIMNNNVALIDRLLSYSTVTMASAEGIQSRTLPSIKRSLF